jgi:hypothetical protein
MVARRAEPASSSQHTTRGSFNGAATAVFCHVMPDAKCIHENELH